MNIKSILAVAAIATVSIIGTAANARVVCGERSTMFEHSNGVDGVHIHRGGGVSVMRNGEFRDELRGTWTSARNGDVRVTNMHGTHVLPGALNASCDAFF